VNYIQLIADLRWARIPTIDPMTSPPEPPDEGPRGTVTIVAVFGSLLVLGWLLLFFGVFVPRGTH
jgi:hypothetical protein